MVLLLHGDAREAAADLGFYVGVAQRAGAEGVAQLVEGVEPCTFGGHDNVRWLFGLRWADQTMIAREDEGKGDGQQNCGGDERGISVHDDPPESPDNGRWPLGFRSLGLRLDAGKNFATVRTFFVRERGHEAIAPLSGLVGVGGVPMAQRQIQIIVGRRAGAGLVVRIVWILVHGATDPRMEARCSRARARSL